MANLIKKNKKGIYRVNTPGAVIEGAKGAARDVVGLTTRLAVGVATGRGVSNAPEGEVTKKLRATKPKVQETARKVGNWLFEEREPIYKGFKRKKQQTSNGYMYK